MPRPELTITIEGVERLSATLKQAVTRLERWPGENSEIARGIATRAGVYAPKRTGALSRSFNSVGTPTYALVSTHLRYAPIIEFGSYRQRIRPRRYFRRAVSEVDPYRVYARSIDRTMDSIKGA